MKPPALHLDGETGSAAELKKVGLWKYMRHPTTFPWMVSGALDDGPVSTWYPWDPVPSTWAQHIAAGLPVWAHNAPFERELVNVILGPRYGWPSISIAQLHCTMSLCYAMGLPAKLEFAAAALGLDTGKDMEGHRLMMQMAKPRKTLEGECKGCGGSGAGDTWNQACEICGGSGASYIWWNTAEKLTRLTSYNVVDVEVERGVHARVYPLTPSERRLWELDQLMNGIGVRVDVQAISAAMRILALEEKTNDQLMQELTGGEVDAVSSNTQLREWVAKELEPLGFKVDSIAKEVVESLLENEDVPEHVWNVLDLRHRAGKTSLAKLPTMAAWADDFDDRIRFAFQFHGAGTGRWAGRGPQFHNFVRKTPIEWVFEQLRRVA